MSTVIPFHCLVFCDDLQIDLFSPHERISYQRIAHDLVGHDAPDLTAIITAEAQHKVELKLSLGQRVAVAAADFPRRPLHDAACAQGASVQDIVGSPMPPLVASLPVRPYDYLQANWRGITVVGDVHGDLRSLTRALRWAQTRENYVWLLGDVVDYGADTLATADAAYTAVMGGTAAMILGNHERKIARWLGQGDHGRPHLRITEGNRVTIDALNALKKMARQQWIGRFRSLLAHASLMQEIDNITLLHAAAHPSLWTKKPNTASTEQFALYGESDQSTGKFRRVHHWIDMVPAGKMVFIGHDTIGPFPTIVSGALGGQVVFLDTGCGTGGYLSSADLRFGDRGLQLECFNRH
jgi:hypothetical protein